MDYADFRRSTNVDDRRPFNPSAPISWDELVTLFQYPMKKDWPSPQSLDGRQFPQVAADFPMDQAAPRQPTSPLATQMGGQDLLAGLRYYFGQ